MAEWAPTAFKVTAALTGATECVMLANNQCVNEVFAKIGSKFDMTFARRAFVHQLVMQGMEEGELIETREELYQLEKDYERPFPE